MFAVFVLRSYKKKIRISYFTILVNDFYRFLYQAYYHHPPYLKKGLKISEIQVLEQQYDIYKNKAVYQIYKTYYPNQTNPSCYQTKTLFYWISNNIIMELYKFLQRITNVTIHIQCRIYTEICFSIHFWNFLQLLITTLDDDQFIPVHV